MRKRNEKKELIEIEIEYGGNQIKDGKIKVSGSLLVLTPPASQQ
jgi:hypothetical protein